MKAREIDFIPRSPSQFYDPMDVYLAWQAVILSSNGKQGLVNVTIAQEW